MAHSECVEGTRGDFEHDCEMFYVLLLSLLLTKFLFSLVVAGLRSNIYFTQIILYSNDEKWER